MPEPDPEVIEKLKSTLWFQVGRIVDEETLNLGVHATPQYTGSLADLIWQQIVNAGGDLEGFAKHRTGKKGKEKEGGIVKVEDVLLLGRRNDGLEGILKDEVRRMKKRKEEKSKATGEG